MDISLGEVAQLVGGQLHGDGKISITGADTIRDVRDGEITFIESEKLSKGLASCQAVAVITSKEYEPDGLPFITVDNVQEAFAKAVALFRPPRVDRNSGVSDFAVVSPTARLADDVTVHPSAVIGDDVEIGSGTTVHSGVQIMAGCKLGENVTLFPGVVLYENTVIGSRAIIHSGVVLGAYGFGYTTENGRHKLSAQLGNVVIGDDVELGACTTIDRGTYGSTVIGDGTKIDNQVMIGHNCRIGRHNIICSQVGVSGSTTTGDYVVMAGQVGICDHLHIGDGVILGAQSGVMNDIPAGETYLGSPAKPKRQQMLILAASAKLPELKKQIKELQRTADRLDDQSTDVGRQEAA